MTNGLLIFDLTKYLRIYSYITLQLLPSEFPVYEENFILFSISVSRKGGECPFKTGVPFNTQTL
jgi:hypothetical protein